ncbi:MAG TPA: hypothetical protein VLB44_00755, partial [Kofleriaceae bacterium]|nr:hypothetical protein [Kofleriaceae bacterium]
MLSPGTTYLLAYLPARRVAHLARRELVDRNAATIDPALKHAIDFSRQALKVDEKTVAEWDARHATLAKEAGIALPPIPADDLSAWLAALPDRVRPHLSTPVLQAAWTAGETGRRVAISVELAAHVAYLRCAAPQNPDLRVQAAERARELTASAATLTRDLEGTGLPLVIANAGNVAKMVKLTSDLEPTTTDGYRQLNELVNDLRNFLEAKVRQLDTPPPTRASAPPTAEEEKLLAQIIAAPHDTNLRTQFAKLAVRRDDPRAELIRLQYSGEEQKANDLVRSHPEWSTPLQQLGARDVKFSGGFPNEITIDADVLLSRGKELQASAPVTRLHVRKATGRVAEIVRSP